MATGMSYEGIKLRSTKILLLLLCFRELSIHIELQLPFFFLLWNEN